MKEGKVIQAKQLQDFCREVLMRVGISDSDATIIADTLVEAELRGVESHGVENLAMHVRRLRDGNLNPRPNIKIIQETNCTAVLDGDNGVGNLVAVKAMEVAIKESLCKAYSLLASGSEVAPSGGRHNN